MYVVYHECVLMHRIKLTVWQSMLSRCASVEKGYFLRSRAFYERTSCFHSSLCPPHSGKECICCTESCFLLQIVKALEHLHSKLSVIHRGERQQHQLPFDFFPSIKSQNTEILSVVYRFLRFPILE